MTNSTRKMAPKDQDFKMKLRSKRRNSIRKESLVRREGCAQKKVTRRHRTMSVNTPKRRTSTVRHQSVKNEVKPTKSSTNIPVSSQSGKKTLPTKVRSKRSSLTLKKSTMKKQQITKYSTKKRDVIRILLKPRKTLISSETSNNAASMSPSTKVTRNLKLINKKCKKNYSQKNISNRSKTIMKSKIDKRSRIGKEKEIMNNKSTLISNMYRKQLRSRNNSVSKTILNKSNYKSKKCNKQVNNATKTGSKTTSTSKLTHGLTSRSRTIVVNKPTCKSQLLNKEVCASDKKMKSSVNIKIFEDLLKNEVKFLETKSEMKTVASPTKIGIWDRILAFISPMTSVVDINNQINIT